MTLDKALETELGPNQSVRAVINETGDTKTIWDRSNEVEVNAAKKDFKHFRDSGYIAYKVTGKEGTKGEVMHEFDATAERIIFAPPMRGGM